MSEEPITQPVNDQIINPELVSETPKAVETPLTPASPEAPVSPSPEKSGKGRSIAMILFGALVVVALVGIVWFLVLGRKSESSKDSTSKTGSSEVTGTEEATKSESLTEEVEKINVDDVDSTLQELDTDLNQL